MSEFHPNLAPPLQKVSEFPAIRGGPKLGLFRYIYIYIYLGQIELWVSCKFGQNNPKNRVLDLMIPLIYPIWVILCLFGQKNDFCQFLDFFDHFSRFYYRKTRKNHGIFDILAMIFKNDIFSKIP